MVITGGSVTNPTVNNYGPKPPQIGVEKLEQNLKRSDGLYESRFRITLKTDEEIAYLYIEAAEQDVMFQRILFSPGRAGCIGVQKKNTRFDKGIASTNIVGVPAGKYLIKRFIIERGAGDKADVRSPFAQLAFGSDRFPRIAIGESAHS